MPNLTGRLPASGTGTVGIVPGVVGASDANDLASVEEANDANPFIELGLTGLKRAAGYVDEEFLPELKGRKAVQIYREMGDNDAIIGTLLFALVYLLRETPWTVEPAGPGAEDAKAAEFLESCMTDMSHSWSDFIAEALSCMQYGWSWHEVVFKRRIGPYEKDPKKRSQYTDGLIGWRKIPIRSQESMQRWVFDENNETTGMVQMAAPDYATRTLPLERSLLFRTGIHKGNPEGRSILRTSYRSWFYKKRFEEHESIGVERDLAGIPIVKLPASYIRAKQGTDQYKMAQAMKTLVRSVRRNEQEGIVFPQDFDDETKQALFSFELLQSGGARQFSTNEIITRLEQRILMTCLADFILVGHEETGTYNMHADKRGIFNTSLNVTIRSVADTINRHAVPKLFEKNGWRPAKLPKFKPSDVDAPDLAQLGAFLAQTAGIGFTWGPDPNMERFMRSAAGLPELSKPEFAREKILARRTEATRMYETQTAELAAKQQLAQAKAASEQLASGEHTPETAMVSAQAGQEQAQSDADAKQAPKDEKRTQEAHETTIASQKADTKSKYAEIAANRQAAKAKTKPKAKK